MSEPDRVIINTGIGVKGNKGDKGDPGSKGDKGDKGDAGPFNDHAMAETIADPTSESATILANTFVRFIDQNGDPLPAGSITTIHVNTVTGDVDDITFEGI